MRTKIFILCLLAVVCVSFSACNILNGLDRDNAYHYVSKKGGFSADFDGRPDVFSDETDTPWGGLLTHEIVFSGRFSNEVVCYTDLPQEAVKNLKPETVLEEMKKSRLAIFADPDKSRGEAFKVDRVKSLTIAGYQGLEGRVYTKSGDENLPKELFGLYRSLLVGNRFYEILVINRDVYPTSSQINMFMDSFALNGNCLNFSEAQSSNTKKPNSNSDTYLLRTRVASAELKADGTLLINSKKLKFDAINKDYFIDGVTYGVENNNLYLVMSVTDNEATGGVISKIDLAKSEIVWQTSPKGFVHQTFSLPVMEKGNIVFNDRVSAAKKLEVAGVNGEIVFGQ